MLHGEVRIWSLVFLDIALGSLDADQSADSERAQRVLSLGVLKNR